MPAEQVMLAVAFAAAVAMVVWAALVGAGGER